MSSLSQDTNKFKPGEHLIQLKGKDYLQVMWRLVWFRDEHPDWCIDTTALEVTEKSAMFVCKIFDDDNRMVSSGHGSETPGDFGDYIEKAETKAVGRALAMLGYGTQFTDDLDEGERIVDSPVERKSVKQKTDVPPWDLTDDSLKFKCENCNQPIEPREHNGRLYGRREIAEKSQKRYGKTLCWECSQKERIINER